MNSLDPALFEPDQMEPTDHVAARPPLASWSDVWRGLCQPIPTMARPVLLIVFALLALIAPLFSRPR